MDRYTTGTVPRLVQSFTGGVLGRQHFTDSETYDDALIIDAYLTEGTATGLARARVIGNALLYVQAHDPRHDGRVRAAYAPLPLTSPAKVKATDPTSDVGAGRRHRAHRFRHALAGGCPDLVVRHRALNHYLQRRAGVARIRQAWLPAPAYAASPNGARPQERPWAAAFPLAL